MDFEPFPKIARLNRDITITEKIDGTNAAILISEPDEVSSEAELESMILLNGRNYAVQAQSRKRLITPGDDNFGFAAWVQANAVDLVHLLGPGRHFGEWWGLGVQRRYSMERKVFSLFNPIFRFNLDSPGSWLFHSGEVRTVPVLYRGPFSESAIEAALQELRHGGSVAAPGFMRPEGIVIYHEAARQLFKVTLENDEKPKGSTE